MDDSSIDGCHLVLVMLKFAEDGLGCAFSCVMTGYSIARLKSPPFDAFVFELKIKRDKVQLDAITPGLQILE